jgi:hypothetical protein
MQPRSCFDIASFVFNASIDCIVHRIYRSLSVLVFEGILFFRAQLQESAQQTSL